LNPLLALLLIIVREEPIKVWISRKQVKLLKAEFVERIIDFEDFLWIYQVSLGFKKFFRIYKSRKDVEEGVGSYSLLGISLGKDPHVCKVSFDAF